MTTATTTQSSNNLEPRHRHGNYGGNPLAHINSNADSARLAPFGGAAQVGLYRPPALNIANPVPLGLSGFAMTTFLLSVINLGVQGLETPSMVVGPSLAYGGLVQLLAGMWDIAAGNTFGGTALSSYGGFWISLGIILTPGGFNIQASYADPRDFYGAFSFYLFGWFIFTFLMWTCTLRSTVVFSALFLSVWLTFLLLALAYLSATTNSTGTPDVELTRAGGGTGIIAAFLAWYIMLSGLAEPSNAGFAIPVLHFPWSDKARAQKADGKPAAGPLSGDASV